MNWKLGLVLIFLATSNACALEPADEASAEQATSHKADGFDRELPFGVYRNRGVTRPGDLVELTLIATDDTPAPFVEGAYELVEQRDGGRGTASGFFNVYRYAGTNWVRFMDGPSGFSATRHEKFEVQLEDGVLGLRGADSDRGFSLLFDEAMPSDAVCDGRPENILGARDTRGLTNADPEAVGVYTRGTGVNGDLVESQMEALVATTEFGDLDAMFDQVKDGAIIVIGFNWGDIDYEWFSYQMDGAYFGLIFEADSTWVEAEVKQGEVFGCTEPGFCEETSSIAQSADEIFLGSRSRRLESVRRDSQVEETRLAQIRAAVALIHQEENTAELHINLLVDFTDDREFNAYRVDGAYDWISFYAGDTETGVIFEAGTTTPVATIGDGNLFGCGTNTGR